MASVDWAKVKTPTQIKALLRHYMRVGLQANPHIDASKRMDNIYGGALEETYAECCRQLDEELAALDGVEGQNKRKDRVTMLALELPIPDGVDDVQAWAEKTVPFLEKAAGKTFGAVIHVDEQHDYLDATTGEKRTSMKHIHWMGFPVDENGKLNAKKRMTKASMRRLNKEIDAMSREEFGVPFLTGKGTKDTRSMEALKQATIERELAEARRQASAILADAQARAQAETAQRLAALEEREKALGDREKALEERERALEAAQAKLAHERELVRHSAQGTRRVAQAVAEMNNGVASAASMRRTPSL